MRAVIARERAVLHRDTEQQRDADKDQEQRRGEDAANSFAVQPAASKRDAGRERDRQHADIDARRHAHGDDDQKRAERKDAWAHRARIAKVLQI